LKDLRGKTVWITGASSGIGESLARRFAQLGCKLILSSRRPEELQRVAATCHGAQAVSIVPLDLSKPEAMLGVVQQVLRDYAAIDVMVHNGGVSQRSEAKETLYEVDDLITRTNYLGPVALTKALLPSMLSRRTGHFVVVTSGLGKFSVPKRSAYCGSKHALHGFFDALRTECWKEGIVVTLAAPGYVKTDVGVNALIGSGARFNQPDPDIAQGISPDLCASRIIDATLNEKREVFVGRLWERVALAVSRLAPGLFFRIVRKK
jgi:dehydrogenase/reductase SDR family protein 7B